MFWDVNVESSELPWCLVDGTHHECCVIASLATFSIPLKYAQPWRVWWVHHQLHVDHKLVLNHNIVFSVSTLWRCGANGSCWPHFAWSLYRHCMSLHIRKQVLFLGAPWTCLDLLGKLPRKSKLEPKNLTWVLGAPWDLLGKLSQARSLPWTCFAMLFWAWYILGMYLEQPWEHMKFVSI